MTEKATATEIAITNYKETEINVDFVSGDILVNLTLKKENLPKLEEIVQELKSLD